MTAHRALLAPRPRLLYIYLLAIGVSPGLAQSVRDGDWPTYGRDPGGTRFSPLDQISRSNVAGLQVAWTYRTGEMDARFATEEETSLEVTPLMVDGTLYLSTPLGRVAAGGGGRFGRGDAIVAFALPR